MNETAVKDLHLLLRRQLFFTFTVKFAHGRSVRIDRPHHVDVDKDGRIIVWHQLETSQYYVQDIVGFAFGPDYLKTRDA